MQKLEYHSLQSLHVARDAATAANRVATEPRLSNDALTAIVMAAASTEAFVNEFPEYAPLMYSVLGPTEAPDAVTAVVQVLQELEESRVPVTTKYLVASQVLIGKAFNTGAAPYQDFKLLIDLRNAIMHIKPTREGDRHPGKRIADVLGQRGLALPNTGPGTLSWFDRIKTPMVASWAHDAALDTIRATLALVPVHPVYDPLDSYRGFF
jgi:hypothetical protein